MSRSARALLEYGQFEAVVGTVLDNNDGMEKATAEQVVEEALKFVATAAQFRRVVIAPSRVVDEGWHALILHTSTYADLCEGLGGMIHHHPEPPDADRYDGDVIERTCALIEEAGYSVNRELWTAPGESLVDVAANCQHSGGPNCGPIVPMPKPKGA
ncbi:glycine-rich domain-containing protein [Streptomyces atacamensis]|uniref:glycine-rich domain-containing protein n=1 Tax=Streptomyces atacamensis TaxID=531966 RepID=UPI00399D53DA